jgi:hypothetical protein
MKTDDLISLLAHEAGAVDRRLPMRRVAAAPPIGALLALPVMIALLGVNPALQAYLALPMFWVKFTFGVVLAAASGWGLQRLGRPGARTTLLPWLLAAPIAVLWLLALIALAASTRDQWASLLLGGSWKGCPPYIALLSLPTFVAALLALRSAAPTRLRLAGAVAGVLAGAVGAAVYALHCPELAAPFLAVWYVIGVLIPAAAGALLGPAVLRW